MKQEYSHLRNLIDSAKTLLTGISINYNTEIGPRTRQLVEFSNQIFPIVKEDHPTIADILQNATRTIVNRQAVPIGPYGQMVYKDFINAYSFGELKAAIKVIDSLYSDKSLNARVGRKIFISHASDDETIVKAFIKEILMLGCRFSTQDIFCTLDHTAIRTGDDFRDIIVDNMKSCDYVICIISENYRKSEVCQNEMGAAWAMENKRVLPFKFPNLSFKEIGFLNVVKQAADITDESKLDELYVELCKYYDLQQDLINFNQRKADFINVVNKYVSS
ncbi:MAG: toll/interleukin-1 receptor domain-containing protein [Prevotella sp.]|nr:toll/interleukin-1 receptor domain-containing protein [Prevotella sp.]